MNTLSEKKQHTNFLLAAAFLLPLLCGYGGLIANAVSVAELLIAVYYFNSPNFWLLTPIYYLFYSQLLLVGDRLSLFLVYALLCLFRLCFRDKVLHLGKGVSVAIPCLMLYAAVVLFFHEGLWNGVQLGLQIAAMVYAVTCIRGEETLREKVKLATVVSTLLAALYGLLFQNIKGLYEEQETVVQYGGRYAGTTSDPNYMAFFYCVAFFFLLFSRQVNPWLKRIGVVLLFLATALTGSLTALITLAVMTLCYVLFATERSKTAKTFNVLLLFIGIALFVAVVFGEAKKVPIFELYRMRIQEKWRYFRAGNLSAATAGRSEYSDRYLAYLFDRNILRILFGGYQLNAMALTGRAFEEIRFAAHNSYVDVIMTSGVVGLTVFLSAFLFRIGRGIRAFILHRDRAQLSDAVYAVSMMVFLLGLSVFPAPTYLFFLLM